MDGSSSTSAKMGKNEADLIEENATSNVDSVGHRQISSPPSLLRISCSEESDCDEMSSLIGTNSKNIRKPKFRKAESTPLLTSYDRAGPINEVNQNIISSDSYQEDNSSSDSGGEDNAEAIFEEYGATDGENVLTKTTIAVCRGIVAGKFPERIVQGSSGSYFCKNNKGVKIGVFKPKNEEPYGENNPKWGKWFQKCLMPCCFGRSCLCHNQGYLSEAGASYIDTKLGLNVVPPTGVVALAAPSFNYGKFDRAKARTKQTISNKWRKMARVFKRTGLPSKVGSLQVFVNGYEDACIMLRKWELKEEELPEFSNKHFLIQFQKLIILDYIIRNTDRGNDNWLIKCVMASGNNESIKADSIPINSNPAQVEDLIDLGNNEDKLNKEAVNATDRNNGETENGAEGLDISIDQSDIFKIIAKDQVNKGFAVSEPSSESEYQLLRDIEHSKCPKYFIAAIDNGLAFPFKHPDEFRGYPYGWAYLPFARIAFLPEITAKFVPLLENAYFVQEMCEELKQIFMKDSNFDKTFFSRQMSVMRGQIFNLKEALKVGKTPYDLCLMTPQYMCEVKIKKQKGRKGQKLRVPVGGNNGREDANTAQNGEAHPNSYIDLDNDSQPGTSRNSSATNNNTWSRLYAQRVQIRKPFFKFW